jgi:hypothetical protein
MLMTPAVGGFQSPCYPGKSERLLIGQEPLTSQLSSSAAKGGVSFFPHGEFNIEKFSYLGVVSSPSGKTW